MNPVLLRDVITQLESLYPPDTAADWDRVGLVVGDLDQPIGRVMFALDPTLAVIDEAITEDVDLVVTHHPLLLRGVHSVAATNAKGSTVTRLIQSGIAHYVAHTNADVAEPGVSHAIADAFGLVEQGPLTTVGGYPAGRVGRLPEPSTLGQFADVVAGALPQTAGGVRVSGDPAASVQTVAIMGGSGDDQFDAARASGADVYVTADLRHHPVLEAREDAGDGTPYLIDAGHWAMESLWLAPARDELVDKLQALGEDGARVVVTVSERRTEPWTFVRGANAADARPQETSQQNSPDENSTAGGAP